MMGIISDIKDNKFSREGMNELADKAVVSEREQGNTVEYDSTIESELALDLVAMIGLEKLKQAPHFHCWHLERRDSFYGQGRETQICCTCGRHRTSDYEDELPENHGAFLPRNLWERNYAEWTEWNKPKLFIVPERDDR